MVLMVSLMALAFSCKKDEAEPAHECGHWEYEGEYGPEHWADLAPVCEEYAHCGGSAQSPVDITGAIRDTSLHGLEFSYAATGVNIKHNGHTIEFKVDKGSSKLVLNGEAFELDQFHFHAQSEHTIDGAAHHMEAHFVHVNAASGDRAVIGIMFRDGAENAFLAQFMNHLPQAGSNPYTSSTAFNPAGALPAGLDYFTYPGSLTTPNCEENVTWFVLEHPVEASTAQILHFRDLMPKNYRPQADIGTRKILHFQD